MRLFTYLRSIRALATKDLAAVVDFLGDAHDADGTEPFTPQLLDRLLELVPCEFATYLVIDCAAGRMSSYVACSAEGTTWEQGVARALEPGEQDAFHRSLTMTERRRRGRFDGPVAWSDFITRQRRLRHDFDRGSCPLDGILDHACLPLDTSHVRHVWLTFDSTGRDFSERDRQLLELLEPHFLAHVRAANRRRHLRALRAALGRDDEASAVVVLEDNGELAYASAGAQRLLGAYFGDVDGGIPGSVSSWARRRDGTPFTVVCRQKRLVVEAVGGDGGYVLSEEPAVTLSPRERDVMRCVADGKSNSEVARLLWITTATVRKHLDNVYEKLGVHSRTAALAALGMTGESR